MKILVAFLVRMIVFLIEIKVANALDTGEKVRFDRKQILAATVYLFVTVLLGKENAFAPELVAGFFWGSFTAAAYSDRQIKQAYDFMLWTAILSAGLTMLAAQQLSEQSITELVIFFLLQWLIFRHLYGAADCLGCSACAVYLAALGRGLLPAIKLLLAAWILLFVVQLIRKNVDKKGRLKEGQPFLPYVAVALLIFVR